VTGEAWWSLGKVRNGTRATITVAVAFMAFLPLPS